MTTCTLSLQFKIIILIITHILKTIKNDEIDSHYIPHNGTVNIWHGTHNNSYVQLAFNNLLTKHPDFRIYAKYNDRTVMNVSRDTSLPEPNIIDVKQNENSIIPNKPNTSDIKQNESCFFNKEELETCQVSLNNTKELLIENTKKYLNDLLNLNYRQNKSISVNEECDSKKVLLDNVTNEVIQLRSDLATCITISSSFKYEADLWASKYAQNQLHSTTTLSPLLPPPFHSNNDTDKKIRELEWNYSSCLQEVKRLKNTNQLFL